MILRLRSIAFLKHLLCTLIGTFKTILSRTFRQRFLDLCLHAYQIRTYLFKLTARSIQIHYLSSITYLDQQSIPHSQPFADRC